MVGVGSSGGVPPSDSMSWVHHGQESQEVRDGGKGRKDKMRGRRMIQRLRRAKGGMQGAGGGSWRHRVRREAGAGEREEEGSGGVWGVASAITEEVSEQRGWVPNCTWWEEVVSKRLCGDSVFYSKTWRLSMELTRKKQRRVFWVEGTAWVKSRGERGLGELKRSLVSMCGSEGGEWRGEREREWEGHRKRERMKN